MKLVEVLQTTQDELYAIIESYIYVEESLVRGKITSYPKPQEVYAIQTETTCKKRGNDKSTDPHNKEKLAKSDILVKTRCSTR